MKKSNEQIKTIRKIVRLAIPIIMGQFAYNALTFVDRYFISKLGVDASAAAALSSVCIWFLIIFSTIVSGGTMAIVARKVGEKNSLEIKTVIEQSLFLSVIIGIATTLIVLYFSNNLLSFFNADASVEKLGLGYFRILLSGFPFSIISQVIVSTFQAYGDTKTPMRVFLITSIVNSLLDPLLIFGNFYILKTEICGFGLGIHGAGLATFIAQGLSAIWLLACLYNDDRFDINHIFTIKPDLMMMKRILNIGVWRGLNSLSRPATAIFMQRIIAFYGTNAIASFFFGLQWITILFIFFEGLIVSVSTLVGQRMGEKDIDSIHSIILAAHKIGFFMVFIFLSFGVLLGKDAISLFTKEPQIIEMGTNYLMIALVGSIFLVPSAVYTASYNGIGDTIPPMVVSFVGNWVGKLGLSYCAAYLLHISINAIWLSISFSIFIEGICLFLWFKKGCWKTKTI